MSFLPRFVPVSTHHSRDSLPQLSFFILSTNEPAKRAFTRSYQEDFSQFIANSKVKAGLKLY